MNFYFQLKTFIESMATFLEHFPRYLYFILNDLLINTILMTCRNRIKTWNVFVYYIMVVLFSNSVKITKMAIFMFYTGTISNNFYIQIYKTLPTNRLTFVLKNNKMKWKGASNSTITTQLVVCSCVCRDF